MIDTIKNAWKIVDLRKKLIYTFVMLVIFRLGSCIPVPLLDPAQMQSLFSAENSMFGFIDMVPGGAFQNATISQWALRRTSTRPLLCSFCA